MGDPVVIEGEGWTDATQRGCDSHAAENGLSGPAAVEAGGAWQGGGTMTCADLARALDAVAVPVPYEVALAEERLGHRLECDVSNHWHGDVC